MFSNRDIKNLRLLENDNLGIHRYVSSLYSTSGYDITIAYINEHLEKLDLSKLHLGYLNILLDTNRKLKNNLLELNTIIKSDNWFELIKEWTQLRKKEFAYMEIYRILLEYFTYMQYSHSYNNELLLERITDFLELMTESNEYDYKKQRLW